MQIKNSYPVDTGWKIFETRLPRNQPFRFFRRDSFAIPCQSFDTEVSLLPSLPFEGRVNEYFCQESVKRRNNNISCRIDEVENFTAFFYPPLLLLSRDKASLPNRKSSLYHCQKHDRQLRDFFDIAIRRYFDWNVFFFKPRFRRKCDTSLMQFQRWIGFNANFTLLE